jgi:hypothetical protein
MRKILAALMLVGLLAPAATSRGTLPMPGPISQRVARADAVVVGKVVSLAEKTEKAEIYKGDEQQMRVATVAVEEAIQGKKAKTVRVAFFSNPPLPAAVGGAIAVRSSGGPVQLSKGQEALLFLTKHPTKKDLYFLQQHDAVVTKSGHPSFVAQRDEARKYAQVLKEAKTVLASKDASMPFESAMMLITRYRSAPSAGTKTEAVPAGESKRLLAALAGADWKATPGRYNAASPLGTFYLLKLQPKDGWTAPKDAAQIPAEAKKWLEANVGKYEMTRFVREADKKDGSEPE